jgi:hypothetical protein
LIVDAGGEDGPCVVKQLEDVVINDGVEDDVALPRGAQDVPAAQEGELLRQRRGRHPDRFLEAPNVDRAVSQQLKDVDAQRVGQRLEELRLELA